MLTTPCPCTRSVRQTLYEFSSRQNLFHSTWSVLPNRPDPSLVYYKIWGIVQQRDCQSWVHNVDEVKQHLLNVSRGMNQSIIDYAIGEGCQHLSTCVVQANYGHLSNCCDNVNILSATRHKMFQFFYHRKCDFKIVFLFFWNFDFPG